MLNVNKQTTASKILEAFRC